MSTGVKPPILIVDDEPDVLFSLKALLRHDFELYTAESGDEALTILSQHPVHVIMTDQRMPGMTGVELMNHARAQYPATVRIVFTGYADIKAVVQAINSGGLFRYITKPWDPDDLIETLHLAAKRYEEKSARAQFAADVKAFVSDAMTLIQSTVGSEFADDVASLIGRAERISIQADTLPQEPTG
ncbi:MAG: response regulator [Planctomycetaceae bacterium]